MLPSTNFILIVTVPFRPSEGCTGAVFLGDMSIIMNSGTMLQFYANSQWLTAYCFGVRTLIRRKVMKILLKLASQFWRPLQTVLIGQGGHHAKERRLVSVRWVSQSSVNYSAGLWEILLLTLFKTWLLMLIAPRRSPFEGEQNGSGGMGFYKTQWYILLA